MSFSFFNVRVYSEVVWIIIGLAVSADLEVELFSHSQTSAQLHTLTLFHVM